MGKYEKHSLDTNGRIVYKQENGNSYLYVNENEHWIVSSIFYIPTRIELLIILSLEYHLSSQNDFLELSRLVL